MIKKILAILWELGLPRPKTPTKTNKQLLDELKAITEAEEEDKLDKEKENE